jgi:hypothetical protein
MTDAQLAAGVAAADTDEGWFMSSAIGEANNEKLVTLIVTTAASVADQSPAVQQTEAVAAVTKVIADNGASSEVSADMINKVVTDVLAAVAATT